MNLDSKIDDLISRGVGPWQIKSGVRAALQAKAKVLLMESKNTPMTDNDSYIQAIKEWALAHAKLPPIAMKVYDLLVEKLKKHIGIDTDPNSHLQDRIHKLTAKLLHYELL